MLTEYRTQWVTQSKSSEAWKRKYTKQKTTQPWRETLKSFTCQIAAAAVVNWAAKASHKLPRSSCLSSRNVQRGEDGSIRFIQELEETEVSRNWWAGASVIPRKFTNLMFLHCSITVVHISFPGGPYLLSTVGDEWTITIFLFKLYENSCSSINMQIWKNHRKEANRIYFSDHICVWKIKLDAFLSAKLHPKRWSISLVSLCFRESRLSKHIKEVISYHLARSQPSSWKRPKYKLI